MKTLQQISILALLIFSLPLLAFTSNDQNRVDENGMRQGYWVITGEMARIPGYDKNSIVEEGEYKDHKKESLWKKYWPNGKLKNKINYRFGQPEGNYSVYYRNGKTEEYGSWVDGSNVGDFKRYYQNGELQQEFFFLESGKRNGMQKYYYENGIVELEANFKQGAEEGVMVRYNEDGSVKEKKEMHDGVLKPGTIRTYKSNPVASNSKPDEEVKQATKVEDKTNKSYKFDPDGYNTLYNRDLQKTQVGEFRKGRLWDGKWYRYNDDGILTKIEIYKEGKFDSEGKIE